MIICILWLLFNIDVEEKKINVLLWKGNQLTSIKKKKKHLLFNSAIRKKHIVDLKSRYCEADTSDTFLRLSQVIITLESGSK